MIRAVDAVGATLVLRMQAVEPFVQQTIKYPSVETPTQARATLPVSNRLQFQSGQIGTSTPEAPPDFGVKAGFCNGLFSSAETKYPITPTCIDVNCTWTNYYTLSFCGSCVDITDKTRNKNFTDEHGPETKYSLPNSLTLVTPGSVEGTHLYNASSSGGDISDADAFSSSFNVTFLAAISVQTMTQTTVGLPNPPTVTDTKHDPWCWFFMHFAALRKEVHQC